MAQQTRYKRIAGKYVPADPVQGECLSCGHPFTGRLGKKFCDHLCRNDYNNKQYRLAGKEIESGEKES